jgi:hypothetical protein
MNETNYELITKSLAEAVLQGENQVPLEKISSIDMPDQLREKMKEKGENVIKDEIERLLNNPFFNFADVDDDAATVQTKMNKILADKIVIPSDSVIELVGEVFEEVVETWQADPISFREAAEDLDKFADEIFNRIENYTRLKPGKSGLLIDLIAGVCELSGLDSVAVAIQLESKLGATNLTHNDLKLVTDRFLRLVKHYKVEHKLTSSVGTGTTLFASKLPSDLEPPGESDKGILEEESTFVDEEEDVPETISENLLDEIAPELEPEPDMVDDDTLAFGIDDDGTGPSSLEDLLKDELDQDDSFSEGEDEVSSVDDLKIIDETEESEDLDSAETEEVGLDFEKAEDMDLDSVEVEEVDLYSEKVEEVDSDKTLLGEEEEEEISFDSLPDDSPEVPDEPEPVDLELTMDSELAKALMDEDNKNYFVNELFDGDLLGYKMMSERICQASDMNRALIIADNELFMLDIPTVAEQASRLMNLIREKYVE